jgi:protein O-mannosyl-transferase
VSSPLSPGQRWLPLALVCVCAALAFANTLANGFVWDDDLLILSNPWLEGPRHLGDIFSTHFWGFSSRVDLSRNYYRPLVHITLMLCRAVFGLQPWGYHLVMALGHMVASGLVYRVGLVLFERREGSLAALASGLLFAVHPIHTEAVAWVSAVNDVALVICVLLALYLLMTSGPGLSLRAALAGLVSLGALLFKEPGVLLFGMVVVYDLVRGGRAWSLRQWLGRYAPLALSLAAYAALRLHALAGAGRTLHHTKLGLVGYVLNAPPLLAQYLGALVLPLELNAFHVFEPVDSPWAPQVLAGVAALIGLALLAAVLWRRAPSAFVALAWCLLPLLPALYIPALGKNTFAERYLYLPSVGFVLLMGLALEALERRGPASRPLLLGGLAVVVVAGGLATAWRNTVWHDNLALWLDTQAKSPETPEIHAGLGLALLNEGRLSEALPHLERAGGSSAPARRNLGLAYAMAGRLQEAETVLGEAVRLDPDNAGAWSNLCLVHKNLKQLPRAIEECEHAAQLAPHLPEARTSLGQVLLLAGQYDEAEQHLRAALELKPDLLSARRLLDRLARERQRAAESPQGAASPVVAPSPVP